MTWGLVCGFGQIALSFVSLSIFICETNNAIHIPAYKEVLGLTLRIAK